MGLDVGSHLQFIKEQSRLLFRPSLLGHCTPEDIAQTAATRAIRYRRRFRGTTEGEFRAWLRAIVVSVIKNEIKRARTLPRRLPDRVREASGSDSACGAVPVVVDPGPSPSKQVRSEESLVVILGEIHDLPEPEREIFILHHLKGHSVEEIADRLGLSRPAVYGHLRRGRERLAKKLRRKLP